jgi:tRNA modification GTPase
MPRDEVARDTIAAIATPPGRGGIGIVRVSGPNAPRIATALTGGVPSPRRATVCRFCDAAGRRIDEGLALYFAAPHSYTGEPVLELHGHGGSMVMQMLLSACVEAGARLAEPGEFTRRAFLEGKLDLAQAEAVADLIDASSREAARSALRSLSGEFSSAIHALLAELIALRALVEAMLDFPEEQVDELHMEDACARLTRLNGALQETLAKSRQGSLLRNGLRVVIAGRPNVGKSSLLNRLSGEERAIVTAVPGTTRDALRESIEIDGMPLVLVDTAGLRNSDDAVERLGMQRTRQELERADVVLEVMEAGSTGDSFADDTEGSTRIRVYNKSDLAPDFVAPEAGAVTVSAKTGAGIDTLREALLRAAGWNSTGESVFLARERHINALEGARVHTRAAVGVVHQWELLAEELRLAQESLGIITGEFVADDLLGEIFSRFCIGK